MTRHMAVRLPVHLGPAAWASILAPQAAFAALEGDRTADFVVVGGGFAGLSALRRLTQLHPGAQIALLEAGQIAEGAAGRNSGFMIDLPHDLASADYAGSGDDRSLIALNRRAIAFAAEMVQEFGIPSAYFDPAGKVNGAVGVKALAHTQSYAAHLRGLGEPSEHLDARDMQALTGSRYYNAGLFTPGTVLLQPAGYVRAVAKGLSRSAQIFERSPVTSLEREGQTWTVSTPKGRMTTPRVILATNGHMESFGFARGRLMHVFLFASMTPRLPPDLAVDLGGAPRWGVTPSDPMGTTMRRIDSAQGGDRIVTRTCAVLRSGMQATSRDLARAQRTQQAKFDARFPKLAGLAPEHVWAGHLCLSRGSTSVVNEFEPGLFSACVQNGLGTVRGTQTGIAAAEMASGISSDLTAYFANQSLPPSVPPRPFRDVGANAVLRWKEWRAAHE